MVTAQKSKLEYKKGSLSKETLIDLYKGILKPRMIEEKMLLLLRQGKISKWFSGIGQEAISIGCTKALQDDEIIFPMHRNLGVFTSRNIPLERLFCQWQGKSLGFTKGRDRSFHFGTMDYNIVGMISHLGPQLSLACGVALAEKLSKSGKVSLAFTGEGGTSQGEFHEALNVASVWQLPVIFVIENNGYGLSTPTEEQYRCEDLADRGVGYGMEAYVLDGNNILEVYEVVRLLAEDLRKNPRPVLIECKTFRMRGHEEASGTKYVPKELMDAWAEKDPLQNFEQYLLNEEIITSTEVEHWRAEIKAEIEAGLKIANAQPAAPSNTSIEISDVFKAHQHHANPSNGSSKELRMIDAISEGLDQAMSKHGKLVLMGQDIADYGGVFKITAGLMEKYGKDRVRNTPLCESAILGTALGLSLRNYKSMVEMQFADFVSCGFNQIVNNLAKLHYRWGQNADVVIRMPTGGGMGAGPFHSQSNEAWFFHVPGIKIVYPSNPVDAKGLLLAAFEDPNPVMYFEHKGLYRSISAEVPEAYYTIEIGKAAMVEEGDDLTLITYGMGVQWMKKITADEHLSADIIDLRSLSPIDWETIYTSVEKTGKVLIVHEDTLTGGIGGEIAARISEEMFDYLDAPVFRAASLDTPFPFGVELEKDFLPLRRIKEKLNKLIAY